MQRRPMNLSLNLRVHVRRYSIGRVVIKFSASANLSWTVPRSRSISVCSSLRRMRTKSCSTVLKARGQDGVHLARLHTQGTQPHA